MTRNWIAVNLILLLLAAYLGSRLRGSVGRFDAENDLARIQPVQDLKKKITTEGGIPLLPPPRRYNSLEFANIPNQNLFAENRAKEEKIDTPVVVETPMLNVKPILVGVSLSGAQRLASIIDPASVGGSTRKTQTKRVGDTYQGFTVTDIANDRMVLAYGNRREVIPLFDASKHAGPSGKTAILPIRTIAFGAGSGGSSSTPGQAAIAASAANVSQAAAASKSGIVQIGTNSPPGPGTTQSGVARGAAQPGAQPPGAAQQPPSWNERTDDQGRRVIKTPFGDVVRPNPPNQ